jgi:hypothetical protein
MVTRKCISDSHGNKTVCLIAPCARWFNCFLGVDNIDTFSVGNASSAVLKGSMAGEFKRGIFGYFSENLGLFRFVSDCYKKDLFVSVVSI